MTEPMVLQRFVYTVPVWLCLILRPCTGDAIILTKAMLASTIMELFVTDEGVRVELEVNSADLLAFRNLLPAASYARLGLEEATESVRLARFFREDLVLRNEDGELLQGHLVQAGPRLRVPRDEITGEPLTAADTQPEPVVFASLTYSWSRRPSAITIQPPLSQQGSTPTASIGFVLYHLDVPVNDFRYLSAPATVTLDWQDSWFSRFQNPNLRRRYDAPLSLFLYVDHFQVRKEVIVRPKDLQQWVDLGLTDRSIIPVEDQADIKRIAAEFLATRGKVTIDGKAMPGRLDRIHFLRRNLRATGVIDPPEPLNTQTATLGVIYSYPMSELPQQATVDWDMFSAKISEVPAIVTDEAGGMPSLLTAESPQLVWTNFLTNPTRPAMVAVAKPKTTAWRVPAISLACLLAAATCLSRALRRLQESRSILSVASGLAVAFLGLSLWLWPLARIRIPNPIASNQAPELDFADAQQVLHGLLYNVYRSFDVHGEEQVYDRLAKSVSGELLTDVYLDIRRSMELANQGGARVQVTDVAISDLQEAQTSTTNARSYRCVWNATGSVGHWGHIHQRTNQYDAELTIHVAEGVWKLKRLQLHEERRLDASPPT